MGIRSQFGPSPYGLAATNEVTDFRFGLRDISKEKGLIPAGRHTGRLQIFGEALIAEIAFLHNPVSPGGIFRVDRFDKGAWVSEIHAPCPVRAGSDTEPAPDAPVIIHHDYAVAPLKRSLRRAYTDAGRIAAVVAQDNHSPVTPGLVCIGVFL